MISILLALSATVSAKGYQECRDIFNNEKSKCGHHASTRRGNCIDAAVKRFDKCIARVDSWQSAAYQDYSSDYGYNKHHKTSYEQEYEPYETNDDYDYGYEDNDYGYKKYFAAELEDHEHEHDKEHKEDKHGKEHKYSCESAHAHFKATKSPTLIQCVSIACAPGQTSQYTQRALFQCYALEEQARATNWGHLPKHW